jgi:hypothetical protein
MDELGKKLKSKSNEDKQSNWYNWRNLKKDLKEREFKAINDVMSQTDVVLATCSGAGDKYD